MKNNSIWPSGDFEVPKFIVDPNAKEVPNGFAHIKENATIGVDRLLKTVMSESYKKFVEK